MLRWRRGSQQWLAGRSACHICSPVIAASVRREPHAVQRQRSLTIGTFPPPASISRCQSAYVLWWHDLHHTLSRKPVIAIVRGGRKIAHALITASAAVRACQTGLSRCTRWVMAGSTAGGGGPAIAGEAVEAANQEGTILLSDTKSPAIPTQSCLDGSASLLVGWQAGASGAACQRQPQALDRHRPAGGSGDRGPWSEFHE
jgi:hypothetical protein